MTRRQLKNVWTVAASRPSLTKKDIIVEFADVFYGHLGHLKGPVHLELNDSVALVKLPLRQFPISVQGELKSKLDRLEEQGVPAQVGSTDWISSIVTEQKKNAVVMYCFDPNPLNKELKRAHHPLSVIDDVLVELPKARIFSILGTKNGFWHVELDN